MCHELSSFLTEEYYNLTYIKINTKNGIHIYDITSNTISLCKMLHHINIRNFRNFEHFETEFSQGITALLGKNGSGKSSLIEAINFLSVGRSFRAKHDRDTINKQIIGTGDFASIKARISVNEDLNDIQMVLDLNNSNRLKKNCSYNGANLRLSKLVGHLKSVCFSVNDMNIIYGSPAIRRKYINLLNLQIDSRYVSELMVYSKIVESRNSLLKQIKNNFASKNELEYWNNKMVETGTYLITSRYKTINQLSVLAESIYPKLFNRHHNGYIEYLCNIDPLNEFIIHNDRDQIYNNFLNKLKQSEFKDIALGKTTIGPHRDDLIINIDDNIAENFASRGQARLLVVGMKLAECELIKKQNSTEPIILLDDAFSELDLDNQEYLCKFIYDYNQCLITGLDFRVLENLNFPYNSLYLDQKELNING